MNEATVLLISLVAALPFTWLYYQFVAPTLVNLAYCVGAGFITVYVVGVVLGVVP
jgi:hypothetical protein